MSRLRASTLRAHSRAPSSSATLARVSDGRGLRAPPAAAALLALAASALAHDTEWPPKADASSDLSVVPAAVQMGKISIAVPSSIAPWIAHGHEITSSAGNYMTNPLWIGFGDVVGADDGELHMVMLMPRELVVAGSLTVDFALGTGTFTPLWVWKDPAASAPPAAPPADHNIGNSEQPGWNATIGDFDGDGTTEVAFVGRSTSSPTSSDALYVVQTDASQPNGPFGIQQPRVLASKTFTQSAGCPSGFTWIGTRVGLARVSASPGGVRREIVTHAHHGRQLQLWSLGPNGSGGHALTQLFQRDCYTDDNVASTDTVAKTHEFNYADVDGDGFDEFFMDGVLDFVNADVTGAPTPANTVKTTSGVVVWRSGMTGVGESHIDHMIAADFDPDHPGLEINSTPSQPFTTWSSLSSNGRDMLWDAATGAVIRMNADAPSAHGQSMFVGNWSSARTGLETIYVPKGASDGVAPHPGYLSWTYSTSGSDPLATGAIEELTHDGAMFHATTNQRAGGPVFYMDQIDWDGDYASDEIANFGWRSAYVWRMGEKGAWSSWPTGMPVSSANASVQWDLLGNVVPSGGNQWYWFTSKPAWTWNFGAPGRFSHYYEKLGEAFGGDRWAMRPYDVGRDYREELVTLRVNYNGLVPASSTAEINVFYNLATLAQPWMHLSPRASRLYRQLRCETTGAPIDYQALPVATGLELTPRTVGMNATGGTAQLTAKVVYSDGTKVDVSSQVTWTQDVSAVMGLSSAGLATATGVEGSSKVYATLGSFVSNPSYVYASNANEPAVLYAGYADSYLVSTSSPNPPANPKLRVVARVAQRANAPLYVGMLTPSYSTWPYPTLPVVDYLQLHDDGSAAHGDDLAGDGVYSQLFPYVGHVNLLAAGDNLRQVVAVLASSPTTMSDPWPYHVVGAATVLDVTGQFDNDAQGDASTPRIAWGGLRGFVDPNWALVEVEIAPAASPTVSTVDVQITGPIGPTQTMTWTGGNTYWAAVPVTGLASGSHLIDVVVRGYDSATSSWVYSDHWPRVRTH